MYFHIFQKDYKNSFLLHGTVTLRFVEKNILKTNAITL